MDAAVASRTASTLCSEPSAQKVPFHPVSKGRSPIKPPGLFPIRPGRKGGRNGVRGTHVEREYSLLRGAGVFCGLARGTKVNSSGAATWQTEERGRGRRDVGRGDPILFGLRSCRNRMGKYSRRNASHRASNGEDQKAGPSAGSLTRPEHLNRVHKKHTNRFVTKYVPLQARGCLHHPRMRNTHPM